MSAVIAVLFLVGPVLIVPLGMRLMPSLGDGLSDDIMRRVRRLALPAGLLLALAFALPTGPWAAALAIPWLLVAGLGALAAGITALRAIRDGRGPRPVRDYAVWATLAFLVVAAGNALAHRAGVQPFGFSPTIVLLTAVHFTFAGFALTLVGVLADLARPSRHHAWVLGALILGMPITAVGFLGVAPAAWLGAMSVALGGFGIGLAIIRAAGVLRTGGARTLARLAGLTLLVSMPLAAVYATGAWLGIAWLDLPTMARTHGVLNVLGFAIPATVAWTIDRRTATAAAAVASGSPPHLSGSEAAVTRIAITGGDGFVGGHLARMLVSEGHDVVVISRRTGLDLATPDLADLRRRLQGCQAVVLCAGINRESGPQTYGRVHVSATRFVVEAARDSGVQRVVLLSFLRARPDGPTAYHRSKWVAEGIVRGSGMAYTVVKPGVIFGRGDHLIDHLSRALRTFPVFGLLGGGPRLVAPIAVQDVALLLAAAALGDPRLRDRTIALTGPEVMKLDDAVRRVGRVIGRHPAYVSLPVVAHLVIAWLGERVMRIPLIALAQVRILEEGATQVLPFGDAPPGDLAPTVRFDQAAILAGLPPDGRGFGVRDLRWCRS